MYVWMGTCMGWVIYVKSFSLYNFFFLLPLPVFNTEKILKKKQMKKVLSSSCYKSVRCSQIEQDSQMNSDSIQILHHFCSFN